MCASQNAKIDSNYHKTLLAVDESTGETKRLLVNASGALKVTGTVSVTSTPAGSDTQVQFNDGGAMGADAGFTYNKTTDTLTLAGDVKADRLGMEDTNSSHYLYLEPGSDLSADRVVTITTGDSNRTISLAGNITTAADFITSGANSLTLTTTGSTNVTLPTTGTLVNSAVTTLSSLASIGTITTGVWTGTDIALADGGTGASLVDPNADRIFFWDDSEGSTAFLAPGNSLAITTTTIDTIQDIRTTATPQFARLGLGQAADASAVMAATGQYFSTRDSNGNSTATATVDWNTGNVQAFTLNDNCTFTFSNPKAGGRYLLELLQDGTGSRTVTWPASVKWSGGTTPTLTTTANRTDIFTFYYNGTSYAGSSTLNYSM